MSLPFFLPSLLATLLFVLYLVPPGFLAAQMSDVAGFRERSWPEKLMWCVALSLPVATMIAVLPGHFVGPNAPNAAFLIIDVAALVVAFAEYRRGNFSSRSSSSRSLLPLWLFLLGCALFCLAATSAVMTHGHLEEGVISHDWCIRIPLQYAAGAGEVPAINPLFTLAGKNPPLRYYYFFYVLCAQPMRLAHLSARSVLAGGTVWACLAFFAVAWLMLRHLALPAACEPHQAEPRAPHIRTQALIFAGLSFVGGLDIVPHLLQLATGGKLMPHLGWWNGESIAAWPGSLPLIPLHFAGLACALLGYLLLAMDMREKDKFPTWIVAAICFASALGMSTFIAGAIMLATILLAADAMRRRQFTQARAIAGSLVLAILLDLFYFVPTLFSYHSATTGADGRQLALVLRNWHFAYGSTWSLAARLFHVHPGHNLLRYAAALPMLFAVYVIDLGFFWFVLWFRVRQDARRQLTQQERALWLLFLGFATLCFFFSSYPMQHGLNDLGRHTALGMRFVLTLWACPIVTDFWHHYRRGQLSRRSRIVFTTAVAFGCIGAAGTLWDVVVQRMYIPLVDYGVIRPTPPFSFLPGVGLRYAELQQAWQAIGRFTPSDAIVQANPDSKLQRPALLYLNRRVAAGDISCETEFGGDQNACVQANVLPLLSLYAQPEHDPGLHAAPSTATDAFEAVCRSLHLSALITTDYDPVWQQPDSWVWHEPTLYSGPHARVLACHKVSISGHSGRESAPASL